MDDLNGLKVILVDNKRTKRWLSEQLNLASFIVSKWDTSMSRPDLESLIRIAKLFNVELSDLVSFKEFKMNNI